MSTDPILLAARLLDAHATVRDLALAVGDEWPTAVIRSLMTAIDDRARAAGKTHLGVATKAAKAAEADGQPMLALYFLAAAVELTEPAA